MNNKCWCVEFSLNDETQDAVSFLIQRKKHTSIVKNKLNNTVKNLDENYLISVFMTQMSE